MAKHLSLFFFLVVFFSSSSTFSQVKVNEKDANQKFERGNYEEALADYLLLLKENPKSEEYNYRIGVCYLNTNINKTKAVAYLENVTKREHFDNNAMYLLGRAYHYAYRFDDALRAYNRFKDVGNGTSENLKDVEKQINYCQEAKALIKVPVNVSFQNLGKNVNSPYSEYFPLVSSDETFMIFTSRRADGEAIRYDDGNYSPSAYISTIKNGNFGKPKNITPIIDLPDGEEEVVGLSPDGNILIIYHDNFKSAEDLYLVYKDSSKNLMKPMKLGDNINTSNHEIAATISNEGDVLYFVSDKPGGKGGTDIYVSRKLPNGEWGIPQNVGEPINTPMNEDFPNLSADGKTLYFSSTGHTSMGGYDIFKTTWNEKAKQWAGVKNLGYPVNTPDDNLSFRFSENGRYGYMSTLRVGGMGGLDVYRVSFNEVEHNYITISGNVASKDNALSKLLAFRKVSIKVVDETKKEIFGTYTPNPTTGKYIIIVPPGNYSISVSHDGFNTESTNINLPNKIISEQELKHDFFMTLNTPIDSSKSIEENPSKKKK